MKKEKCELNGVLIFTPEVYKDERGYFFESFSEKKYKLPKFVQENESCSKKGVLRGLHFQLGKYSQGKLIRVIKGKIFDVIIDLRKNSKTFGKHFSIILSDENKKQLYIPSGFAHGFLSLENNTIMNYKCTKYYNKKSESGIIWNDKTLNIKWYIKNPILSVKDFQNKSFKELFN
ncbi:MAG: dTDP-4-dehydrorhamnose 3,5-epimerase [Methanobacterium sp.]|nr:dTDP-4-dehydrorhamnose 3,5-epimerase [Methanobacterium sp.]